MEPFDSDSDDDDDIAVLQRPLWLLPAAHRPSDGDPVSPPPKTILLDKMAYVDGELNDTTAKATRSDGDSRIQVTFWNAHPPRVSYFTVHSPGHTPDVFPRLPRIIATDDDLALLIVTAFSHEPHLLGSCISELFIYRAGTSTEQPSLRLLPKPDFAYFSATKVAILSCRADNRFFITSLCQIPCKYPEMHYFIQCFDSTTWKWDTKQVYVESPESCLHPITDKVITIGGKQGSVGWVNLWHGILVYDVLLGNNVIRHIPLPRPCTSNGLATSVRDIVVINGFIKYFCMYLRDTPSTKISGNWQADTWTLTDPSNEWNPSCHFQASEIMPMTDDNPRHYELPPNLPEDINKLVWERLRAGSPVLSLHDDDVVYIMIKDNYQDYKAWVLAVKMSTKTIQGVAEFETYRTVGFTFTYTQSGIFKHLGVQVEENHHQ